MPLEVNELGIFMKVMDGEKASQPQNNEKEDADTRTGNESNLSKNELVEECVAKILEILERKNRR